MGAHISRFVEDISNEKGMLYKKTREDNRMFSMCNW
jgi:hypothetical protein